MEIYLGFSLLLILGIGQYLWGRKKQKHKRTLMERPLPPEFLSILEKNLPVFARFSALHRQKLMGLINLFLDEKEFTGCQGLEITDEIRVTIAAQACLLLLNNKTQPWYKKLASILVYPSAYQATSTEVSSTGVFEERQTVRLGESWGGGTIVLSWSHSRHGGINFQDGQNVVIHEFAHQLDQASGPADGIPLLSTEGCYASWAAILGKEYKKLTNKALKGQRSVMDYYGATNEAEFFAVASESFFEKPRQMSEKHPELYKTLNKYYGLDPISWL